MKQWLDLHAFLGIAATEWVYAALAALVSYVVISNLLKFAIVRLEVLASRTATQLDDMVVEVIKGTHRLAIMLTALLIGMQFLELPQKWAYGIDHLWFIVIGFQIGLWLSRGVALWARKRSRRDASGACPGSANPVITTMLAWILRAFLWSIVVLVVLAVLANMGVNITAFVASLGVGGVAVALAVQNILSDLFASAAIGLDKPYLALMTDFAALGVDFAFPTRTVHIAAAPPIPVATRVRQASAMQ